MDRKTIGLSLLIGAVLVGWLGLDNVEPVGDNIGCALSGNAGAECTAGNGNNHTLTRAGYQQAATPVRPAGAPASTTVKGCLPNQADDSGWSQTITHGETGWRTVTEVPYTLIRQRYRDSPSEPWKFINGGGVSATYFGYCTTFAPKANSVMKLEWEKL